MSSRITRPPLLIRGGPQPIVVYVANLGANLWGHSEEGKTASIRVGRIQYKTRCQNKAGCSHPAVIQIECRDHIGHPFWNQDFCEAHGKPLIEKAERLKIPVSWPQQGKFRAAPESQGGLSVTY